MTETQNKAMEYLRTHGPATAEQMGVPITTLQSLRASGAIRQIDRMNSNSMGKERQTIRWEISNQKA